MLTPCLALYARSIYRQRGARWTPADLFAGDATGLWLAGGDPARRYGPSAVPGLYLDAAGTSPLTAAGQSAGMVLDLSEGAVESGGSILGNHATQATNANEPTLAYDSDISKYYWSPDGADWWECDGAAGTFTGNFEIHAAVRWMVNAAIISKMDTSYDASPAPQGWMLYSNANRQPTFLYRPPSGGTVVTPTAAAIEQNTDVVISAWRDNGTIYLTIDGVIVSQISVSSSSEEFGNFPANLQIFRVWRGSNDYGSYWNNRLYGDGLVVINNKSLTADERSGLVKYLARQQGRVL